MKRILTALFLLLAFAGPLLSQVAINADGSSPNSSAMLDVKSSNKGLLPPRMTHAEINAIPSPANGLIVYCTDCGTDGAGSFYGFYNGSWQRLLTCTDPATPAAGISVNGDNQITWKWNAAAGATGYKWNSAASYATATDMGTNLQKTETGLSCGTAYTRYVWSYNACGISAPVTLTQSTTSTVVLAPAAGTHTASLTQIVWNWNAASGALGYKWNTVNNYATATDMGAALTKTETGLTCGTAYTRYVWGYNNCGYSYVTTLTQSTAMNPAAAVTIVASANPVCAGTAVTFTATPVNGGSTPGYQWKVNANNASNATNATYTYTPVAGDVVTCVLTSSTACTQNNPATSNAITMTVNPLLPVSVTIAASANPVCAGTGVTFTATPVNGGSAPGYQWKVNATNVSNATNATYTYIPVNGDAVTCVLTSSATCATGSPASSNALTMTVNSVPVTPVAGTHVAAQAQIIWNWNSVAGATGYKWNTTNSYATATDMGAALSKTETGLTCGTAYTRYAWAYNACGNSTAVTLTQSTSACPTNGAPCPGTPTVTYWGKTYNTVKIGNQCWLKENLNVGSRIDHSVTQSKNGVLEKYCYNDLESNCDVYGGMYQWAEMVQYLNGAAGNTSWDPVPTSYVQGLCPSGWHIPTSAEQSTLVAFLGNSPGGKMKEAGTSHWLTPNTGATNESGFTSLPGGLMYPNLTMDELNADNYLWSCTEAGGNAAAHQTLRYYHDQVDVYYNSKAFAFSVRCIKDTCSTTSPVSIIVGASSGLVSAGTSVVFYANPVNGGTNPVYQWKVNGTNVGTGASSYTYTPSNGDQVTCTLTSSLTGCLSGNPAISPPFVMQVVAAGSACPGTPTVTYGGKTYNTVLIGGTCWMKENLDIGTRINGIYTMSNNAMLEKYCYNDLESNCTLYGGLYQWGEMVQYLNGASNTTSWNPEPSGNVQGICPSGWHLPNNNDWGGLAYVLGGSTVAGGNLKMTGTSAWLAPNTGATNSSGFSAYGAGHRENDGTFLAVMEYCNYWTSTNYDPGYAWSRAIGYNAANLWTDSGYEKSKGFSVRCVKD